MRRHSEVYSFGPFFEIIFQALEDLESAAMSDKDFHSYLATFFEMIIQALEEKVVTGIALA